MDRQEEACSESSWEHFIHIALQCRFTIPCGILTSPDSQKQLTKDFVDGSVGWQSTVDHCKLAFEATWDIVTSTTRMNHGSKKLNVNNVGEVTGLL